MPSSTKATMCTWSVHNSQGFSGAWCHQCCVTPRHCQGHSAGPKESSQGSKRHRPPPAPPLRAGHKAWLHRSAYPPSSSNRGAMAHWGAKLHWEGVAIPRRSASIRHWAVQHGAGAEAALSWSHLAKKAKAWGRTKNEFGEGREKDKKHRHKHPRKHRAEGPDTGGHKPQPAAASTASHGHCQYSHNARPSWVGSFPLVSPQPGC